MLSSWRSLHRMVQPKASSWMKIDLLISSKCALSLSRTDPSLDNEIDDERDGVGDTGAATNTG